MTTGSTHVDLLVNSVWEIVMSDFLVVESLHAGSKHQFSMQSTKGILFLSK